mmetsp:Transcript_670/g.1486  ORF Transcript_670/g.1486 Transcript_670/m.1486 type:complete len:284 (+) Transcript_670:2140-2991(+)
MPEPSGQRLPHLALVTRVHPDEGRRAGAAVEVFVAAAHREIGRRAEQVDRHRAGAVGQVPDGERARLVGPARQQPHVVHAAGAVVHMGQHQHRTALVEQRRDVLRRLGEDEFAAMGSGHALGDVVVGREVAALADHDLALALLQLQGGVQHLVEVGRGRVRHQHLARPRAQPGRQPVTEAPRQVDPSGRVPALDEALAPFLLDRALHACRRGLGQGAERVAVQIGHALGQREEIAQAAQGVGGVKPLGIIEIHRAAPSGWHAQAMRRRRGVSVAGRSVRSLPR